MKNVFVIISGNRYPEGDAGAVREHAFALILKDLGYTPLVVSMGTSTDFQMRNYDGVDYYSLRYKSGNVVFRILGRLLFNRHLKCILKKIDRSEIKGVMYVSGGKGTASFAAKFASENSVDLYHDSVEWYSPEEFSKGEKSRSYRENNKLNTQIVGKGWRTVAISSYLYDHFKARCDKAIRIPVIMDVGAIEYSLKTSEEGEKLSFAYAGSPGTKDYLAQIISGFSMLSDEEIGRIKLHIVGVTKEQLISACGVSADDIEKLGSSLAVYGRVPRKRAVDIVRTSDFSLLLRDEELRYAKAGFPTKIVESLSCGTPPVCNYSSDLPMYLEDGKNAFIIPGNKAENVKETIRRILDSDKAMFSGIRENARKTAEEHFYYKKYVEAFSQFVKN